MTFNLYENSPKSENIIYTLARTWPTSWQCSKDGPRIWNISIPNITHTTQYYFENNWKGYNMNYGEYTTSLYCDISPTNAPTHLPTHTKTPTNIPTLLTVNPTNIPTNTPTTNSPTTPIVLTCGSSYVGYLYAGKIDKFVNFQFKSQYNEIVFTTCSQNYTGVDTVLSVNINNTEYKNDDSLISCNDNSIQSSILSTLTLNRNIIGLQLNEFYTIQVSGHTNKTQGFYQLSMSCNDTNTPTMIPTINPTTIEDTITPTLAPTTLKPSISPTMTSTLDISCVTLDSCKEAEFNITELDTFTLVCDKTSSCKDVKIHLFNVTKSEIVCLEYQSCENLLISTNNAYGTYLQMLEYSSNIKYKNEIGYIANGLDCSLNKEAEITYDLIGNDTITKQELDEFASKQYKNNKKACESIEYYYDTDKSCTITYMFNTKWKDNVFIKGKYAKGCNKIPIELFTNIECIFTLSPTETPTSTPTQSPSNAPTPNPTNTPTISPTNIPTNAPTYSPTIAPSNSPTFTPTNSPTYTPTQSPTHTPSNSPTQSPTYIPTQSPSNAPTPNPTIAPTISPTNIPTNAPTYSPTIAPSDSPTLNNIKYT